MAQYELSERQASAVLELRLYQLTALERTKVEAWGEPEVIFDLGANVGFASVFFARRHPRARIIAVEADPGAYSRLVRNVRSLPNVTTLHRAVAARDGTATFFRSGRMSISSSLTRAHPDDEAIEVQASSLQTLMNEVGVDHIDLVKMDIEGAEFDVLASSPLGKVRALEGEIHLDQGDEATLRRLLSDFDLTFRLPRDAGPNLVLVEARRVGPPSGPGSS